MNCEHYAYIKKSDIPKLKRYFLMTIKEREKIAVFVASLLIKLQSEKGETAAICDSTQTLCYVYNRCRAWFGMDGDFQKFAEEWRENKAMLAQYSEIDALAEKVCEELKKEQ